MGFLLGYKIWYLLWLTPSIQQVMAQEIKKIDLKSYKALRIGLDMPISCKLCWKKKNYEILLIQ